MFDIVRLSLMMSLVWWEMALLMYFYFWFLLWISYVENELLNTCAVCSMFFFCAVDCLDPTCSGRGVCVRGECHCFVGWGGPGCESPRASCMEQCSGHGTFLADTNTCNCDPNWTGHDCSTGQCSGRMTKCPMLLCSLPFCSLVTLYLFI